MAEPLSSRDKILDVAEALFADRGYAGIGLREVAETSGLSKSSLFHHFRSKEQLYHEVHLRVLRLIRERFDAVLERREASRPARSEAKPSEDRTGLPSEDRTGLPGEARTGSPREQLERWIEELIDTLAEHPTVPRLLLRSLFEKEDSDLPEARATEALLGSILGDADHLIRRGIECGDFRRVSAPHMLQTLIGATIYHFASAEVGEGILGRPLFSAAEVARRKREVIALLRDGLFERAHERPPIA